jgi:hypothetical protein
MWGYSFGILKAYTFESFGHFIFDFATVGFYSGLIVSNTFKNSEKRIQKVVHWVYWLVGWPVIVALIPMQHYLVQIIGLRGNIFWIPMLLVGAILDFRCIRLVALCISFLNIFAFLVALAEYVIGVDKIFPENEATKIVLHSNDIAGGHHRIPSTFTNAHTYAAAMVSSIPWILMHLFRSKNNDRSWIKIIEYCGILVAVLGVFVAGPKTPAVLLFLMLGLTLLFGRIGLQGILALVLIGSISAYFINTNERFQRFTEVSDLDGVVKRMEVSVNSSFLDILLDNPVGDGMGSGGTSLPGFAQNLLTTYEGRKYLENEYSRVILEQGWVGLAIFLSFAVWIIRIKPNPKSDMSLGRVCFWVLAILNFSIAWMGIGMMSVVPGTALFFMGIGLTALRCLPDENQRFPNRDSIIYLKYNDLGYLPAYQRGLANS